MRLAVILAILVAGSVGLAASVGYVSSAQRLEAEVDRFLADRSAELLVLYNVPERGPGPLGPRGRFGVDLPRFLRLDAEVQILDGTGEVVGRGEVELPVDETARSIAAGRGSLLSSRTVEIEGVPYRLRTTAIPVGGALQVARDYRETANVLDSLRDRFLLIGVLGVAAAGLVGLLVARQVTRPLEQLTAAAELVARTGDLSAAVPEGRRDETGRLAVAFSTMLSALAESRDQQVRLVQDAGHELRTPVTSLRTNAEVLRRYPDLGIDQRDRILADIDVEARELGQLVDELVLLASGGQDDSPFVAVDLAEVAEVVAERMRRRTGREVTVSVDAPSLVPGRPAALERAVGNLVDNAAKFAPDGPIEVHVVGARVEVSDRGPGFSPGEERRVFERFYRSDTARSAPGSGLGLAIVAQVVGAHGGRVVAGNRSGGGAVVGFDLSGATSNSATPKM